MARTAEEMAEARRAISRRYLQKLREENPEKLREQRRKNKERYIARNREKYLEAARRRTAAYRAANPDKVKASVRQWHAENVEYQKCKRLRKTFGLTLDQWNQKLAEQGFRCDCCGSADPKHKRGWQTDHDHSTGKVRGLLCGACNIVLTYQLTEERLEQMRLYLVKHGSI